MQHPLLAALLGATSARLLMRVEDGQFTREYSRLYTALVLSFAVGLIALVGVGIALARRDD